MQIYFYKFPANYSFIIPVDVVHNLDQFKLFGL